MSDPPLLCIPGLGLDERALRPTLDALGAVAARVAPLPGYGVPPEDAEDLDPAALGRRVAGWLARAASPSGPVVLLGHSASCQVVVHAATLVPEAVRAVVLVGPTTDPRGRTWPALVRRWTATAAGERPGQVPVLARCYPRTGLRGMVRAMDAARRDDVREPLRRLRCPVLVVRGRHDRICPPDWAAGLAALAPPGSASVTLAAGAHMVPLTHGPALAATLARTVLRD